MKNEFKPNMVEQATIDFFEDCLENNDAKWTKMWKETQVFAKNHQSGYVYNGLNAFSLGMRAVMGGYASNEWITYNQIGKKLGLTKVKMGKYWRWEDKSGKKYDGDKFIIEGQKASPVEHWSMNYYLVTDKKWKRVKLEEMKRLIESGTNERADFRSRLIMDGYHWLYNLDQTIIDAPKVSKKKGRKKSAEKLLEDMRSGYKNPPKQVINGHNPCYIPSKDTVLMPDISQFLEIDEKYGDLHWLSTGFHEHGHSAGAKTRIYSEEGMECISKGSHNYAKEEFVAEITACMLMGHYGEECRFIMKGKELTDLQSQAYISGWSKALNGDKKKHLVSAIRQAVKRTAHILGA